MSKFHYYNHKNAEILIFGNYLINQIKEGVTVTGLEVDSVENIIDVHFSDSPWVYISNRTNSYSVDPMSYKKALQIKNLKGMAIVISDQRKKDTAKFEQNFAEIPIAIFNTLTKELVWADSIVADSKK